MVRAWTSANILTGTGGAGNQTDVNAGPECDISSSGIFFIGTENARLLTSDCVAPTSINLIDLEPCWYPPDLQHPHWAGEVDQSVAGGHGSNNDAHGDHCLWHEINIQIWFESALLHLHKPHCFSHHSFWFFHTLLSKAEWSLCKEDQWVFSYWYSGKAHNFTAS